MGKINLRIGNDRKINWAILRNGQPEDFRGREVTVKMIHIHGEEAKISYSIEDNRVHIVFLGKDQKRVGDYSLLLIENEGKPDMFTVDHCEEICLVAHTFEEGGACSELDIEEVNLSSDITEPASGLSAYEIAVGNGFVGTEAEWLASLKGEKGDKGDDGCLLYPKLSVNSEMELVMETDAPTNRLDFNQNTGELILTI